MVTFRRINSFESQKHALKRLQDVQEEIFRQLQLLIPDEFAFHDSLESRVAGSPVLRLEALERHAYTTFLRLTYEFSDGDDRSFAPDAHIRFYSDAHLAEATSYNPCQGFRRTARPSYPSLHLLREAWRRNRALDRWLERRRELRPHRSERGVFLNRYGQRLTARSVAEASIDLALSSVFRSGVAAAARSLALDLAPEVLVNVIVTGRDAADEIVEIVVGAYRGRHERETGQHQYRDEYVEMFHGFTPLNFPWTSGPAVNQETSTRNRNVRLRSLCSSRASNSPPAGVNAISVRGNRFLPSRRLVSQVISRCPGKPASSMPSGNETVNVAESSASAEAIPSAASAPSSTAKTARWGRPSHCR